MDRKKNFHAYTSYVSGVDARKNSVTLSNRIRYFNFDYFKKYIILTFSIFFYLNILDQSKPNTTALQYGLWISHR